MKNCFRRLDHLAWNSAALVLSTSVFPKGDICLIVLSMGAVGLTSHCLQESCWVRLKISCSSGSTSVRVLKISQMPVITGKNSPEEHVKIAKLHAQKLDNQECIMSENIAVAGPMGWSTPRDRLHSWGTWQSSSVWGAGCLIPISQLRHRESKVISEPHLK